MIQSITDLISGPRYKEAAITAPAVAEDTRLSWQQLLEEAVNKPGTIHEAYLRFWNCSLGNQMLALIQCRGREPEPGPLASFRRWKELGLHVKKGEKPVTLCMPIQIKAKDRDQKRREENPTTDTAPARRADSGPSSSSSGTGVRRSPNPIRPHDRMADTSSL